MRTPPAGWLPVTAIVVVAAAVVAGLLVTGTPQRQRELRLDERRVSDLLVLSSALTRRYGETGRLPASIDALVDGRFLSTLPRDPASDESYVYESTGAASYRLCATFAREAGAPGAAEFWYHPPGRHCFDFDYSEMLRD